MAQEVVAATVRRSPWIASIAPALPALLRPNLFGSD